MRLKLHLEFPGAFVDACCSPWPTRYAGMTFVRASHVSRNAAVSTGYVRVYMQERIMEFIHTTASTVEKLKRLAKQLRKSTQSSLAIALDAIARQHGYAHWKHVTVCLEKTAGTGPSQQSLPSSLLDILYRAAASDPVSAGTQQAFGHGFVFAMDVKDADELSLTSDFEEYDDGWYVAARDLWRALVHYRDEETGTTLFEAQSPEDLAETALDDLLNYRFFRYLGSHLPASVEDACGVIHQMSFFPPTHIWLGGKFIDISDLPEVRVDGKVILSNRRGFTVISS